MSDTQIQATAVRDGPEGIGGWLILPTIGLCLSPLRGLVDLSAYTGLSENFQFLTSGQKLFILLEGAGSLALVIALPIYLLFLLFTKKQSFPAFYVAWAVLSLAFVLVDLIALKLLFGDILAAQGVELVDQDTIRSLVGVIALVVIWAPYMLLSRRVRNTFTQ